MRGIYDPPRVRALLYDVSIARRPSTTRSRPEERVHVPRRDPGAARRSRPRQGLRRRRVAQRRGVRRRTRPRTWRQFLAMLYVLLGFSMVVSLFGMVNTLVLSVFERTRELGMLRAIGMTRRQARRMIRHESVITALIGAALGLGLGVLLAALGDPGAVGIRHRADPARPDAGGVHARRGARRDRRGDHAGAARLAAERARRPPLRVRGRPAPLSAAQAGGARVGTAVPSYPQGYLPWKHDRDPTGAGGEPPLRPLRLPRRREEPVVAAAVRPAPNPRRRPRSSSSSWPWSCSRRPRPAVTSSSTPWPVGSWRRSASRR